MVEWKSGDAAVCVFNGRWVGGDNIVEPGPDYGQIVIINSVIPKRDGDIYLGFVKWKPRLYWHEHFRRIPPIEFDEADLQIIDIMKRGTVKNPEIARLDINRALSSDSFQSPIRFRGR